MPRIHVARQPFFRATNTVYAYELLFRDGPANAFPVAVDGDTATSQLLHHSFFGFDFDVLTAGAYGFVNFTEELLVRRLPMMFPPERLVVEVLEGVPRTPAVVAACQELARAGYRIALDDYVIGPEYDPLLDLAALVKLDLRATPLAELPEVIRRTRRPGTAYVAEKVETQAELAAAAAAGCTYFQGYFFSRPEVLSTRDIGPQHATLLRLIHEANRPEHDLAALEALVSQDVSITYKLLRYINSAFFRRPRPLESVRQAIVYLGEREIRQFVSLVATAKLSVHKPEELVHLSILRARACDQLGKLLPPGRADGHERFLLGLLSLLDAIMDRPMELIVGELPLSDALRRALVERTGPLADCLALVVAHEDGRWADFARLAATLGIDEAAYPALHLDALTWARSFMQLPD